MFYGNFADERDNPMNKPNIYKIDEDNRLSPVYTQVVARYTTSNTTKHSSF
jgi:hypothetical protein